VPFPVQVLAESAVSDGLGHRHVTGYRYRDGWYAPDTREFRGFAQVVRTELGDANEATVLQVHGFDLGQAAECRKGSLLSGPSHLWPAAGDKPPPYRPPRTVARSPWPPQTPRFL